MNTWEQQLEHESQLMGRGVTFLSGRVIEFFDVNGDPHKVRLMLYEVDPPERVGNIDPGVQYRWAYWDDDENAASGIVAIVEKKR